MVALGYDSTLPVTLDEMIHHGQSGPAAAPSRSARRRHAFGSYHSELESLRNAVRFVKKPASKP